jgi:hypothetical protein
MASKQAVLPWSKWPIFSRVFGIGDDASTTVLETCRVLDISKSSYYAALREGRRQALETAEAA